MPDLEWARQAAKRFQGKLAEKSQRDALFLEAQKLRHSYADDLWGQLEGAFNSASNEFNRMLQRQVLTLQSTGDDHSFIVRRNEPSVARLYVSCRPERLQFTVAGIEPSSDYVVKFDRRTGEGYLSTGKGKRVDPVEVAKSQIDRLLDCEAHYHSSAKSFARAG